MEGGILKIQAREDIWERLLLKGMGKVWEVWSLSVTVCQKRGGHKILTGRENSRTNHKRAKKLLGTQITFCAAAPGVGECSMLAGDRYEPPIGHVL